MKIYLINQYNSNLYKIGITKRNIKYRLKEIQTCNGNKVDYIFLFDTKYDRILETALHKKYYPAQTIGEWFELTDDQVNEFLNECKKIEQTFDFLMENNSWVQKYNKF